MSKAAAKQRLQSDDFRTQTVTERRTGRSLIPSLPTLGDNILEEDDPEGEDSLKLRPVNIDALKEYMIKKVNKLAQPATSPQIAHGNHGSPHKRLYQLTSKHLNSNNNANANSLQQGSSFTGPAPPRAARASVISTTSHASSNSPFKGRTGRISAHKK
jgi:hypothetical protein